VIKQHVKDATSTRALCQKAIEEAKTATRDNVGDEDMVIMLVTVFGKTWRYLSLANNSLVRRTTICLKQSTYLGFWTAIQEKKSYMLIPHLAPR
jgi:hypothetical protein